MGTTSNNPFQFDEWGEKLLGERSFTSQVQSLPENFMEF